MKLHRGLIAFMLLLGLQFGAHAEIFVYKLSVSNATGGFQLKLSLDYDPSCRVEIDDALTKMSDYLRIASDENRNQGHKALAKITLEEKQTRNSKCAESIFEINTIYAAISLHSGINYYDHRIMTYFLGFIQRKHLIKPLTDEVRAKHAILNDSKVMGAYYCTDDVIWLDPNAAPLNRASILMHELEHWAMAHLKTTSSLNLNGRAAYLYEEFISALNPALTQVSLRSNVNRSKDDKVEDNFKVKFSFGGFSFHNPDKFYRTERDVNLYSSSGVLSRSWKKIILDIGIKRDEGYRRFLLNDFLNIQVDKKPSALSVLQMIEEVYFGNVTSESVNVFNYLKENKQTLQRYINPLDEIVYKDDRGWGRMGPTEWDSIGKPFCEDGITPYPGGEGGSMSIDMKLMNSQIKACLTPHKDF
jgi:hypothetical protein